MCFGEKAEIVGSVLGLRGLIWMLAAVKQTT